MADQEIDSISVSFTADTSGFTRGAQQAADTLSELGQSAERAGEEAQGLTGVLDAINASLARIEGAVNASTSAVQQMTTALSGMSGTATAAEAVTQSVAQIGELSASAAGGVADVGEAAAAAGTGLSEVADGLQDAGKGLAQTEDKTDDCSKALEDMARQLDEARTRSDKLEIELSDLQKELDGIKDKAGSGDLFAGLAKGAAALGIGKLFKEAVDGAGELEQNIGGSASVFKEYAGTVQTAAKSAYESLGLSESKYLATATKMGALFQGTGSSIAASADMTTNAMKRAADVASIMGISIDDAMYSISGMAKGNFTMMDNLGVAMNDTTLQIYAQEKGLGKLETTQQKVNAAYQMFMDKTEYAARNYEKENATYAGSLTTLKAEFENFMAEAGTAVMPLVAQGIKLLSGALNDLSPIVTTIANGVGALGDVIGMLPEPLVKMATYTITATMAFRKLNAILGATGSRLMLIAMIGLAIFGKLAEAAEASGSEAEGAYDGMENGIESATDAQDALTDSIKQTEKAANRLAGFDEITKLSGSQTSAGISIGTTFDTSEIDDYSAAVEGVADSFGILDNGAAIVLDNIKNYWGEVWQLITSGNWEGVFKKLGEGVDSFLTDLFGDSWIQVRDYWGRIFNMVGEGNLDRAMQTVFSDVDTILTQIFGDTWTNFSEFWQKIGAEIASGDIEKALRDMGEGIVDIFNGIFGEAGKTVTTFFRNFGSSFYEITHGGEINAIELQSKYNVRDLQSMVVDYLKQGLDTDVAVELAKSNYLKSSEAVYWYENVIDKSAQLTDENVERWQRNLIESGQIGASNALNDPLTATDMMAIMGGAGGMMNGPLQINTTVEIDGEAVGRSVASYNNEQNYTSNGAAAYR